MPKNFYNLGQVLWGLIFFLNLLVFFSFLVTKFVLFYIFFEISLIPIFFIIGAWGSQPERIEARAYLLFYTVFGSLPLLVSLVYLKSYWGSLDYL
jgi:NADH-quinone oxidoreductase subunit M